MLLTIANIAFFLIAVAMTVLILLQRGQGAAAGSGFGAGASATVFGARGSANFLSRSTAVLATLFFVLSLGMAVYASRNAKVAPSSDDLGVMGAMVVPAAPPQVPGVDVPIVPPGGTAAAPAADLPAAESGDAPVDAAPAEVEAEKVEESPGNSEKK